EQSCEQLLKEVAHQLSQGKIRAIYDWASSYFNEEKKAYERLRKTYDENEAAKKKILQDYAIIECKNKEDRNKVEEQKAKAQELYKTEEEKLRALHEELLEN